MWQTTTLLAASVLAATAITAKSAHADDVRAAWLPPIHGETDRPVAVGVARVVQAELERNAPVRVTFTPRLPLRDLQLAVGCSNDSAECMREVAALLEVDELVALEVRDVSGTIIATLRRVDTSAGGSIRHAVRRAPAAEPRRLLDEAAAMVRELYDLPPPAEPRAEPEPPRDLVDRPDEGASPWPWVLVTAGAAALGAGAVVGVLSDRTHEAWTETRITTAEDADRALALYERAEREALWANTLLIGGAALAVGGLGWALAEVLSSDEDEVTVGPNVGPDLAVLSVAGRWEAP